MKKEWHFKGYFLYKLQLKLNRLYLWKIVDI